MTDTSHGAVLAPLRARIDALDDAIVEQLAERIRVVEDVVAVKREHGIPARLEGRTEAVVAHVRQRAERVNCPPDLAEHLWRAMIEWIIAYEERHLAGGAAASAQQETAHG